MILLAQKKRLPTYDYEQYYHVNVVSVRLAKTVSNLYILYSVLNIFQYLPINVLQCAQKNCFFGRKKALEIKLKTYSSEENCLKVTFL